MHAISRSIALLSTAVLFLCGCASVSTKTSSTAADSERAQIEQWRAKRVASLTSDTGWLTLAGLFWLKPGENSLGRAPSNSIALDNPALADTAASFIVTGQSVRFIARPGSGITHDGQPVSSIDLVSDAHNAPTVLEDGPLRFFVIERAGHLGVRVRDLDNPRRKRFQGLTYFPVKPEWAIEARFEPYEPKRSIKIINILGMEEEMESPGAIVFTKGGRQWRLDTVLEEPADQELFVMFADLTSGRETYGAGRFLYVPLPPREGPAQGTILVDFNKAYNPPCAFNDFATCPLPPYQNRLELRVDAGEKKYTGGH